MKIMYCVYLCKYMLETLVSERQKAAVLYGDSKSVHKMTVDYDHVYWAGVYQRSIHKPLVCVLFSVCSVGRSVGRNGMRFCEKPVHTIFHSD